LAEQPRELQDRKKTVDLRWINFEFFD